MKNQSGGLFSMKDASTNQVNCMICKEELVYLEISHPKACEICHETIETRTECKAGHFVCDKCHAKKGKEFILHYLLNNRCGDPLETALMLMRHPSLLMHGPEHHFLVPAVLLNVYYHRTGRAAELPMKLKTLSIMIDKVVGGFCGFYGACGAGVGSGIFFSMIMNTTPLSGEEWGKTGIITADILHHIASHGGPRCCKRAVYTSIQDAVSVLKKDFNLDIPLKPMGPCEYPGKNKECLFKNCPYFKGS
jgi:hypothetical protein